MIRSASHLRIQPARRTTAARDPLVRLLVVALAVVAVDLATKMVAITTLSAGGFTLAGPFFLDLLYNDRMFGGLTTLGGLVLQSSIASSVTLLALALPIVRPLSRHDSGAPMILGLMSGAAVANPLSLLLQPAGVTDFLGVQLGDTAVLFNVADIAAYLGVAFTGRMLLRLWSAHRAEAAPAVPARTRAQSTEREVRVPLWHDRPMPVVPTRTPGRHRTPADCPPHADHHQHPTYL